MPELRLRPSSSLARTLAVMPTALDFGPFARLCEAERRRLVGAARTVDFPAGATLIREGDPPEDAFVVLSGRVRVHAGDVPTVIPPEIVASCNAAVPTPLATA